MKKYVALILIKILVADETLYEENFIEITAESLEQAKNVLNLYIEKQNFDYKNVKGELVTNRFYKIIDINEVLFETPTDNIRELYSRHFKDIEAYKKMEKLF